MKTPKEKAEENKKDKWEERVLTDEEWLKIYNNGESEIDFDITI